MLVFHPIPRPGRRGHSLLLAIWCSCSLAVGTVATGLAADPSDSDSARFPLSAKRIVFVGDSNTFAGGFVAWLEAELRAQGVSPLPEFINVGLPSETCSGLSEPDHPFPRPDVHERLDRVLQALQPDVVVAGYGMNDGIYYPFSVQRFAQYQRGIRSLIENVHAAGAKLVLLTPPAFDPLPMRKQGKLLPESAEKFAWFNIYEGYDQVMQRYADWILEQAHDVELVVDIHTPVKEYLAEQRRQNPDFAMSSDGVHVDATGHRIIGQAILHAWGGREQPLDPALLDRVAQGQQLLRDAWLTRTGHKRPGMKNGLPVEEAQRQAAELLAPQP